MSPLALLNNDRNMESHLLAETDSLALHTIDNSNTSGSDECTRQML